MSAVTIVLALLIGGSLGLVGGGGSILTVPALVLAGGFAPRDAIVASLIGVGVAAAAGAFVHWRLGTLDAAVVAWFGGLGAVGAMGGARLGRLVPAAWLMMAFAFIAVTAGLTLLSRRGFYQAGAARLRPALVVPAALGLGFLTGLLGVGGGFIIVPALVLVLGLPIARAVGTSLAVIAVNCAAGLTTAAADLDAGRMLVTGVFATLALIGTLVGARTASRARPEVLGRVFGSLRAGQCCPLARGPAPPRGLPGAQATLGGLSHGLLRRRPSVGRDDRAGRAGHRLGPRACARRAHLVRRRRTHGTVQGRGGPLGEAPAGHDGGAPGASGGHGPRGQREGVDAGGAPARLPQCGGQNHPLWGLSRARVAAAPGRRDAPLPEAARHAPQLRDLDARGRGGSPMGQGPTRTRPH